MNVVQVYAPTSGRPDVVENFYKDLQSALKLMKKDEITVIRIDFNTKISCGAKGESIRNYSLGERNISSIRHVQFSEENNFIIADTFFKHYLRRLYTWKSSAISFVIKYFMFCCIKVSKSI